MQRHTAFEQSVKLSDNPPNHLYQIPSPTTAACVYGIGNMLRQEMLIWEECKCVFSIRARMDLHELIWLLFSYTYAYFLNLVVFKAWCDCFGHCHFEECSKSKALPTSLWFSSCFACLQNKPPNQSTVGCTVIVLTKRSEKHTCCPQKLFTV